MWPRSWGCAKVLHARALPEDSDYGNQGALSLMWGQELGAGHVKGESCPATDSPPRLARFLCAPQLLVCARMSTLSQCTAEGLPCSFLPSSPNAPRGACGQTARMSNSCTPRSPCLFIPFSPAPSLLETLPRWTSLASQCLLLCPGRDSAIQTPPRGRVGVAVVGGQSAGSDGRTEMEEERGGHTVGHVGAWCAGQELGIFL